MWCFAQRNKSGTLAYDYSCWTISGTFSPGWIKKISSLHKEVLFNYGEERKDQDWDSLWLPPTHPTPNPTPPHTPPFSSRWRGKERGWKRGVAREGGHRWPFGLSVRCPPRAEWAERRKGRVGVKGKGVCVKMRGWGDWCVHFLCSLLGCSRRWIFTHSSPLHLVTEMCAKTPPTSRQECGVGGAPTNKRTKEKPGARKEASVWVMGQMKCSFAFSFVWKRYHLTNSHHNKYNACTS